VSIIFLPHNSQGVHVFRILGLPTSEVPTCIGSSDEVAVPVLRRGFWVASGRLALEVPTCVGSPDTDLSRAVLSALTVA